jgi:hypothetical protein
MANNILTSPPGDLGFAGAQNNLASSLITCIFLLQTQSAPDAMSAEVLSLIPERFYRRFAYSPFTSQ